MRVKLGLLSQGQEYKKWNTEELYKLAVLSPKYRYDDKTNKDRVCSIHGIQSEEGCEIIGWPKCRWEGSIKMYHV